MAGDNETLREKAAKKLHGPNANPSQLGDPISLKAETSKHVPTNEERGAAAHGSGASLDTPSSSSSSSEQKKDGSPYAPPLTPPPSHAQNWESNTPSKKRELENQKKQGGGGKNGDGETLREKAAKKLNGPDANPSQLGDPISLKNETSEKVPTESEEGAHGGKKGRRDSKL